MTRRRFCIHLFPLTLFGFTSERSRGAITLAKEKSFRGEARFLAVVAKAQRENWAAQPIGKRMVTIGRELAGTRYVGFTLEIDDRIECPSCNFDGLDCWTFFETVLGIARMLETPRPAYSWEDLLREIEWTRYRGGRCTGGYLERIHYLDEWFFDNFARGNVADITRQLPGAQRLHGRRSTEMTTLWRSYRYLRNNPSLRPRMKTIEQQVGNLPVYYVPKSNVRSIEPRLQDGDIIGIVTKYQGGVCSHVGLAARSSDGVLRFLHASRNYKKVLVDKQLSGYLADFSAHAGIMVARPLPVSQTIRDERVYKDRLAKLQAGQGLAEG
ncbi:MAG: N-acetylmuramoyl-L-alanine amidase-like domain-containing protein [Verrucomicrobiales bacterium]